VKPLKNLLAIYAYRHLFDDSVAHVRLAGNEKPECVFLNSQNGPRAKQILTATAVRWITADV